MTVGGILDKAIKDIKDAFVAVVEIYHDAHYRENVEVSEITSAQRISTYFVNFYTRF